MSVPSFSGRVPQFIIPILQHLQGNKAKAILISTHGNRAFDDIEELKKFSIQCRNILNEPFSPIDVPGNKPYRKYVSIPITPKTNKQCIDCGLCYQKCPVHAIPSDNYRKCNTNICISCLQCITVCPKNARHVNALILKIAECKMKKLCSGRKPNVLFFPSKQPQNHLS